MAKLELYAIGSKAMLHETIEVTVTAINIRGDNHVQYEISWVDGRSHTCKFVESCELTCATTKLSVGFRGAA